MHLPYLLQRLASKVPTQNPDTALITRSGDRHRCNIPVDPDAFLPQQAQVRAASIMG